MPSLLKRLFLATIGRLVKWMYRAIMLLHLGVLLLERGSAHDAGGADAEQRRAQQQLLSGAQLGRASCQQGCWCKKRAC